MFRNKGLAYIMALCLVITAAFIMPQSIFGTDESTVIESDDLIVETDAPAVVKKEAVNLNIAAKSAVLLDANSGTFLYEQNSHEKLPPASITKIMTMLLVLEAIDRGQISLKDEVTISERAASMGGSQMYMEQGEQQSVETF